VCDVQLLRDLSTILAVGALAWRLKNSLWVSTQDRAANQIARMQEISQSLSTFLTMYWLCRAPGKAYRWTGIQVGTEPSLWRWGRKDGTQGFLLTNYFPESVHGFESSYLQKEKLSFNLWRPLASGLNCNWLALYEHPSCTSHRVFY
jgi:hypothetical protein